MEKKEYDGWGILSLTRVVYDFHNIDINQMVSSYEHILPERDRKVISQYFGLETGQQMTLEEIADFHGITRERVRQLKERALIKIRQGLRE